MHTEGYRFGEHLPALQHLQSHVTNGHRAPRFCWILYGQGNSLLNISYQVCFPHADMHTIIKAPQLYSLRSIGISVESHACVSQGL